MGTLINTEEINEIISMHTKEYKSANEIAILYAQSSTNIKKLLNEHNVYNPEYGKVYRGNIEIREMLKEGKKIVEIAKALETDSSFISNKIKRYNLRDGIGISSKEKAEHINADRHLCKTCKYRIGVNYKVEGMHCNYIEITGHMRGCDAADCDKYEKGKMLTKKLGHIVLSDNFVKSKGV